MEQPCYKCGQVVEEGVVFCPHCGAPQIRVVIAEAVPTMAIAADSSVALSPSISRPADETVPALAVPLRWSDAAKPCALAAIITVLLVSLGLYPFVALVGGGLCAVLFYRQRYPEILIKPGLGVRLGALTGLFTFAIVAVVAAAVAVIPSGRTKLREFIVTPLEKWVASHPGDQAALDQIRTPEGMIMTLVLLVIFLLLLNIVCGGLGGALGASIFGRRNRG